MVTAQGIFFISLSFYAEIIGVIFSSSSSSLCRAAGRICSDVIITADALGIIVGSIYATSVLCTDWRAFTIAPRLMLGVLTSLGDVQRGVAPVHLLWFLPPPPHLYVCGCPRFPDRLTRPRLMLLLLCCFSCICPPKLKLKVSLSTSSLEYHLKAICYCPLLCPIAYWLPSLLLTVHCCRRE